MKNSILHSEKRPLTKGFLSCLLVFLLLALPFWIAATLLPFSFASWLSWLLSGWLTWTFTEYSVHRFYMHRAQPNLQQKLYQSHMNHHRNPSRIKITLWQRLGMFLCGIILLYFSYALHPLIVIFTGFFPGVYWVYAYALGSPSVLGRTLFSQAAKVTHSPSRQIPGQVFWI